MVHETKPKTQTQISDPISDITREPYNIHLWIACIKTITVQYDVSWIFYIIISPAEHICT